MPRGFKVSWATHMDEPGLDQDLSGAAFDFDAGGGQAPQGTFQAAHGEAAARGPDEPREVAQAKPGAALAASGVAKGQQHAAEQGIQVVLVQPFAAVADGRPGPGGGQGHAFGPGPRPLAAGGKQVGSQDQADEVSGEAIFEGRAPGRALGAVQGAFQGQGVKAVIVVIHDLADGDVVGKGVRATSRAIPALVALADFLSGLFLHACHEISAEILGKINDIHSHHAR